MGRSNADVFRYAHFRLVGRSGRENEVQCVGRRSVDVFLYARFRPVGRGGRENKVQCVWAAAVWMLSDTSISIFRLVCRGDRENEVQQYVGRSSATAF